MCPRAITGKHCKIDNTLCVMKTRLLIKLHLERGERPEKCEEAVKRLTPSTIRYQVRRSWVLISFPQHFLPMKSLLKCSCIILQWKLWMRGGLHTGYRSCSSAASSLGFNSRQYRISKNSMLSRSAASA